MCQKYIDTQHRLSILEIAKLTPSTKEHAFPPSWMLDILPFSIFSKFTVVKVKNAHSFVLGVNLAIYISGAFREIYVAEVAWRLRG